jgi:SulP family sulfate permease
VDNEEFDHINGRPVTKYLVLDFEHVLGVDATAARTCFLMIVQLMRASNIYVVFTELSAQIEDLLRAHGVLRSDDIVIPKLDDALEWCEEQILCSVG